MTQTTHQNWLLDELRLGFKKLLCLGWERQPAAEVIQATLAVWYEVIAPRILADTEHGKERVRKAFKALTSTRHTWPSPAAFLEALPRPEHVARVPRSRRLSNDSVCKTGSLHVKDIFKQLRIGAEETAT